MTDRQVSDSVFEALFRQAVIDNLYDELDSLPSDEELAKQYTFSQRHEERMKKLFARERRNERLRATLKVGKRAAAAIIIAISILFGALMSVPEVRATVVQTVVEWFDEFVRFTSSAPRAASESLEPTWIPDGFREEFRDEMVMSTVILYQNDDGKIILFDSSLASGLLEVDNEYAIYEIIIVDGVEYHILIAIEIDGENSIIWELDGWRYFLRSTIPVEYLQKMALFLVYD